MAMFGLGPGVGCTGPYITTVQKSVCPTPADTNWTRLASVSDISLTELAAVTRQLELLVGPQPTSGRLQPMSVDPQRTPTGYQVALVGPQLTSVERWPAQLVTGAVPDSPLRFPQGRPEVCHKRNTPPSIPN